MATSTKWRFDFHALNSDKKLILFEVAIYNGATNLCTGGTATADSVSSSFPANTPDKAFDGSGATRWDSGSSTSAHWLQYEFASAITNPTSYSIKAAAGRPPRDWTLSYWDGAAWVVCDAEGPLSGSLWAGDATLTFPLSWPVEGVGAAAGSTTVTGVSASTELLFANASRVIGLAWAEITRPSEL
jgi:hypothetical protein